MKIVILYNDKSQPIGWEMSGENSEEISKLGIIRDLQFWGYNETDIKYNGRKESDDVNNNPGKLSWVQKRFSNDKH